MLESAFISLVIYHIALKNGFYNKNSVAHISNNPGRLRDYRPSANDKRCKRNEHGIVEFPTPSAGIKALHARIKRAIRLGRSLYELCERNKNLTEKVIATITSRGFDITSTTNIRDFLERQQDKNEEFHLRTNRVH